MNNKNTTYMLYQKNNKWSIHVMKNIKCTQLINTTIQSNNIGRSKRKWHENNQEGNENPWKKNSQRPFLAKRIAMRIGTNPPITEWQLRLLAKLEGASAGEWTCPSWPATTMAKTKIKIVNNENLICEAIFVMLNLSAYWRCRILQKLLMAWI